MNDLTIEEVLDSLPSPWRVVLQQSDDARWYCHIVYLSSGETIALSSYQVKLVDALAEAVDKAFSHEEARLCSATATKG